MSKLVHNYPGGKTDEYGTQLILNRIMTGDVAEGFQVVPNGTPNMTVLVQPGSGRIMTGTYPSSFGYLVSHDTSAGESVTIATAAASPRIDYIVAYINKSVTGSTGVTNNTNNVLNFASVVGTPSGSPVVPTLSQIQTAIGASNPFIILAQIAVGASVTSITSTNITDLRTFATTGNDPALGFVSYIDLGLIWSGSTLTGSMTAGKIFLNIGGVMVPVSVAAVGSNTFTASRDTYVSVDTTGVLTYNPQTNGAASPTLPTNSVWIAKIVTGESAITSIVQNGVSSIGNRIYPKAPDAANALIPMARQGGSSSTWATGGTTNYDLRGTGTFVQVGAVNTVSGVATLTFPVPFSMVPIILATTNSANGANVFVRITSQSVSSCVLTIITDAGGLGTGEVVDWIAIGI